MTTVPVEISTNEVTISVREETASQVPVNVVSNRTFQVDVSESNATIPVGISEPVQIVPVECGIGIYSGTYPEYEGEYEFTPSQETQVVETRNKVTRRNITINPIPQNYGLITWNGSVLTVS